MEIKMKTTDHVTDHVTDHACEVSLIEQLKSIPLKSREWIKNERGLGLRNIPYGRYCQEAAEALQKAEAEVKEIRSALGDDGRRTHKEILELATKASQWREWKEKYIDLKNAHIAEGQDPAGTIWEHADKLQKELKEAKAEVERLKVINADMRNFLSKAIHNEGFNEEQALKFIYQ